MEYDSFVDDLAMKYDHFHGIMLSLIWCPEIPPASVCFTMDDIVPAVGMIYIEFS